MLFISSCSQEGQPAFATVDMMAFHHSSGRAREYLLDPNQEGAFDPTRILKSSTSETEDGRIL